MLNGLNLAIFPVDIGLTLCLSAFASDNARKTNKNHFIRLLKKYF